MSIKPEVEGLYHALLRAWDDQDAAGMAAYFADEGVLIGFDGSLVVGRAAIEAHLDPIFKNHPTPLYVAKIQDVRTIHPDVLMLRAATGLMPRGMADINPALNAIQSVVFKRTGKAWPIMLFQNTPAAWHGRDDERKALTEELRAEILSARKTA